MTETHLDAIPIELPDRAREILDGFVAAVRAVGRAMRKMVTSITRTVRRFMHAMAHASNPPARCAVCHPYANPVTMGRRGALYHERARRRTRRR